MTATYETARDDILTLFKAAWDAGTESAGVKVIYPDVPADVPKTNTTSKNPSPWARITIQHTDATQGSLTDDIGHRRWSRSGFVSVQIFTAFGTGLSLADKLAMIAARAFEGRATASQIWFRNVRVQEIGQDGSWFQMNVIAEFTYDEVR